MCLCTSCTGLSACYGMSGTVSDGAYDGTVTRERAPTSQRLRSMSVNCVLLSLLARSCPTHVLACCHVGVAPSRKGECALYQGSAIVGTRNRKKGAH
eukprot:481652-Rhodomonas_salina.1